MLSPASSMSSPRPSTVLQPTSAKSRPSIANNFNSFFINVPFLAYKGFLPLTAPAIAETINSTKKTKKRILAMPAAAPATPPKPSTAAMMAMIRNVSDHDNMMYAFLLV